MTRITDQIVDILAPVIGRGLAASAISVQCKKMGILPEQLSEENIPEFATRFKLMLKICAGDKIADDFSEKIGKVKEIG